MASSSTDKDPIVVQVVRFQVADGMEVTFEGSMGNNGKLTQH